MCLRRRTACPSLKTSHIQNVPKYKVSATKFPNYKTSQLRNSPSLKHPNYKRPKYKQTQGSKCPDYFLCLGCFSLNVLRYGTMKNFGRFVFWTFCVWVLLERFVSRCFVLGRFVSELVVVQVFYSRSCTLLYSRPCTASLHQTLYTLTVILLQILY